MINVARVSHPRQHAPFGYVVTYCILGIRAKKGEPISKYFENEHTLINTRERITGKGKSMPMPLVNAYIDVTTSLHICQALSVYIFSQVYCITFFRFCQCFLGNFSNFGGWHYENVCEFFCFSQMQKRKYVFFTMNFHSAKSRKPFLFIDENENV